MAIVAVLTATAVPAKTTNGSVPQAMYHVTVAPASGAGTYTFPHTLEYLPTMVIVIPQGAQGSTPTLLASWDVADTTAGSPGVAGNVAINISANGTYDVYFG